MTHLHSSPIRALAWIGFFFITSAATVLADVTPHSQGSPRGHVRAFEGHADNPAHSFNPARDDKQSHTFNPAIPDDQSPTDTVRVTIEIPAGSNDKIEADKTTGEFIIDRVIRYLPYPANYGFIPGTLSGDGDPLDVILLSKRIETGSQIDALPLATMLLRDRGEIDDKVVMVPADTALSISDCQSLECFQQNQPDILHILETWFLSYKGAGVMELKGWAGTDSTRALLASTRIEAQKSTN